MNIYRKKFAISTAASAILVSSIAFANPQNEDSDKDSPIAETTSQKLSATDATSNQAEAMRDSEETARDEINQKADAMMDDTMRDHKMDMPDKATVFAVGNIQYDLNAKTVLGMNITNHAGDKIGSVSDMVLNNNDKIVYAIVSVGGFLGIGDKLVAVPFENLKMDAENDQILLEATKQQLKNAPEFNYKK